MEQCAGRGYVGYIRCRGIQIGISLVFQDMESPKPGP